MAIIRGTKALCKRCSKWHDLEYQNQINGTQHLVYRCPLRKAKYKKKAVEFLPYKPNLPIPSYDSDSVVTQRNQIKLFGH